MTGQLSHIPVLKRRGKTWHGRLAWDTWACMSLCLGAW